MFMAAALSSGLNEQIAKVKTKRMPVGRVLPRRGILCSFQRNELEPGQAT